MFDHWEGEIEEVNTQANNTLKNVGFYADVSDDGEGNPYVSAGAHFEITVPLTGWKGAIDKGIGSAASSMAAKEGLMGTLGNALGGSAVTGAAGTGMMAALGPIGIGIGLGKLFGVFNDGGKVPYTKRKKSPLSGE